MSVDNNKFIQAALNGKDLSKPPYKLDEEILLEIEKDIKNITQERKNILGLKFDTPQIMGALNITPDSFSDGVYFLMNQKRMIKLI